MDIGERLARERRARLAAERILEQKKRELYAANQQLALQARALSDQVAAQRLGLEEARSQAEALKGQNLQALSDLARANTAATMAERRLWAAIETLRDGFALFDRDMHLVAANRAYLAVFPNGTSPAPGLSYDRILKIAATGGVVDLEGVEPQDWYHEMTARIVRDRIEPKVVRLLSGRSVRLIDRRSEDGDLVSLAIDITDTLRREADLEEARARAEAATRAKSAFLANMTHELRTPMNGVVGMAELLAEGELTDEQRLFAETIRSSGEALLAIINDVLDYSKAEAERLRLYPQPFDLERCIHDVMLLVQPSAAEKGLRLVVDYDPSLPTWLVADPGRMRQVLMNLIGNAVKFTGQGHALARVTGVAIPQGGFRLQIVIEDTGIGIAPEHAEHVFGEFNQVQDRSNRRYEGTGLGLAITRQLVELMGGTVWVESELGKGASFGVDITLPVAEPDMPAAALQIPGGLAVGVVMQDAPDRTVLARQLEAAGARVMLCASLEEAERLCAGQRCDALLVEDLCLPPGADGPGQSLPTAPPVIVLASGADAGGEAGFPGQATLRKPVYRGDLYRLLGEVAAQGPADASQLSDAADPAGRRMRVLAAEDNRTNQLVFRKMVKELDMDLVFAGDGREAVTLWRSFRPDLVFMDISMPEMDGRDATREIRRAEAETGRPRVPIVALTAHALNGDEEDVLAAGLDHYMTKPLRKAAIVERIVAACPPEARPVLPDMPGR